MPATTSSCSSSTPRTRGIACDLEATGETITSELGPFAPAAPPGVTAHGGGMSTSVAEVADA